MIPGSDPSAVSGHGTTASESADEPCGPARADTAVTRTRVLLMSAVWAACVVALLALGVWQIERRAWKLDLIDHVEQRVHAAAVAIPSASSWSSINAAADEYRHVTVRGRFLHDGETFVHALTVDGPGYWVMTPLQTGDGDVVLVNRGFVPPERRDPSTRRAGNPAGPVDITGLLRISEPGGRVLRTNDPATDRWYSRDVAAIAAARGLSQVAPFFIDADDTPNPGGWPRGGLTIISFPNNHLVYALTWFCLALMLAGAGVQRWRRGDTRARPNASGSETAQR
ncbi:MAG: surfeit locus 1 family protein [Bradyrhizobium sp.]